MEDILHLDTLHMGSVALDATHDGFDGVLPARGLEGLVGLLAGDVAGVERPEGTELYLKRDAPWRPRLRLIEQVCHGQIHKEPRISMRRWSMS